MDQHFTPPYLLIDTIVEFQEWKSQERYGKWSRTLPKSMCGVGYLWTPSSDPSFLKMKQLMRETFLKMLENTIFPEVLNIREDAIFQLDGAPPHLALQERGVLNNVLPVGWFGRGWRTAWPPQSPDIISLDFFH